MRISDWSSDVCSSDLVALVEHPTQLDDVVGRFLEGLLVPFAARRPEEVAAIDVQRAGQPVERVGDRMDRSGAEPHRIALVHGLLAEPLQPVRSEEHTSELQSLMRISYAVFCLKKKNTDTTSL